MGLIFSSSLSVSDTLFETAGVAGSTMCSGRNFHKWKQKPHHMECVHAVCKEQKSVGASWTAVIIGPVNHTTTPEDKTGEQTQSEMRRVQTHNSAEGDGRIV